MPKVFDVQNRRVCVRQQSLLTSSVCVLRVRNSMHTSCPQHTDTHAEQGVESKRT